MNSVYPMRQLGDVLELDIDSVEVRSSERYRIAGVFGFGRGVFEREPIMGTETKYKKMHRLHQHTLVYSKLKAFEGAFALVKPQFAGAFVSSEFPTFSPTAELDSGYLAHICRWSTFWELLADHSHGVGARRERLHPNDFLAASIPLPDIDEQQRIADHLDRVASLQSVLSSCVSRRDSLMAMTGRSVLQHEFERFSTSEPVAEVASVERGAGPRYDVDSESVCINQGCVQWAGMAMARARGVDRLWAEEVSDLKRVGADDVLVNSTGEGTIGRACLPGPAVGLPFDSHVLAVRPAVEQLLPAFLNLFLRSPQGQSAIEDAKGANTTKQTELGKRKMEALRVPVPDPAIQAAVVARLHSFMEKMRHVGGLCDANSSLAQATFPAALNQAFAGLA